MKRDFTNENFERFLKQSADNLRMKAPDRVWQNLSHELNKRRRRFILGLGTFLLIASTTGFFITNNVSKQATAVALQSQEQPSASSLKNALSEKRVSDSKLVLPLAQQSSNSQTLGNPIVQIVSKNNFSATGSTDIGHEKVAEANNLTGVKTNELSFENNFAPTIVDSYTEFDEQATTKKEQKQNDLITVAALPLTIESVINTYKAKKSKRKIEKQFYFSPTISYRKLTENKSYLRSLDPANIPSSLPALKSSVSNNVTHKPDLGFELGFTTKFPISNKLKLRTGVQFNVNRYDVKAFSSPLSIATIALNNGPTVDSLSTISGYSNVHGYKSNWLQNFSFQVSAPIGIEYNFSNTDDVQFGMATTIQPTYVLGDRAYLITTDYKSYTQVPWLIRRWNVNTALEAFVKYKSWQFGPQVRYQLLSSFISKYPVKENLFDFGLKVGVLLK